MFSVFLFRRSTSLKPWTWGFTFLSILFLLGQAGAARGDGTGPNLLPGDFESGTPSFNPWSGVDDKGLLRVWPGRQQAVDDSGHAGDQNFSPSVAVGDLNGDG